MFVDLHQVELRYEGLRVVEPGQQKRLVSSLLEHGQQSPVLVSAGEEADRWVLVDGYARVAALLSLSRDQVDATVLGMAPADALVMCHRLDGARRRNALEEGWLCQALEDELGLGLRGLASRLGRSRSWVSRRLALVRVLPGTAQEAVRRGRIPAQAAMKYLVPLSRDNASDCERLVLNVGSERLTERQWARLYLAWRRGDAVLRERIIAQPLLYLQAEDEAAQPEPPEPDRDDVALLLGDFEGMSRLGRRARGRLRRGGLKPAVPEGLEALRRGFEEVRLVFLSLVPLTQEVLHARRGDAHGSPALEA